MNSYFSKMNVCLRKGSHYLFAAAKVLVVALTLGYIFFKLQDSASLPFAGFVQQIARGNHLILAGLLFTILAAANWFFEILKWQTLVCTFGRIDFKTALKQSLASLTVSLATPNRIGEYGAKALFFQSRYRKKILLLNFFSGMAQMAVTVFFGLIGLLYLFGNFNIPYSVANVGYFVIGLIFLAALAYYFKEKELLLKGLSVVRVFNFFRSLPAGAIVRTFLFSLLRYAVFSAMFFGLLRFFGSTLSPIEAFPIIFAMYLLVSVMPAIFVFDVIIRGGVAVWLFSLVGVPEVIVLATVLAQWLYNFVFPALVGSYWVFTFQPATR